MLRWLETCLSYENDTVLMKVRMHERQTLRKYENEAKTRLANERLMREHKGNKSKVIKEFSTIRGI